jgi:predicted aldo/keto reductase-like oxidoreductase
MIGPMMTQREIDHEDLKETLRKSIEDGFASALGDAFLEHEEHHNWVRERILHERSRKEFWVSLTSKSLPGIVWAVIAGVITFTAKFVSEHWK